MTAAAAAGGSIELLLRPRPIVGLTRGIVAIGEADRELAYILARYQRAVERMRSRRTAQYAAR